MCYSKRSSFSAWIIGLIGSVMLINRKNQNDIWMASYILCFTLVQLFEAGIWHSFESNNKSLNSIMTKCITVALWLQPIVLTLGAQIWGITNNNTTTNTTALNLLLYILIGALLYSLWNVIHHYHKTVIGPNGHLVWKQIDSDTNDEHIIGFLDSKLTINNLLHWLFLAGILYPFLFHLRPWSQSIPLMLVGFLTYNWKKKTYMKTGEFGSMWCFWAVSFVFAAWFTNLN